MAKNPLYSAEVYTYSGMYNDKLLSEMYYKASDSAYSRSVLYQEVAPGNLLVSSSSPIIDKLNISDLVVVDSINDTYGFPSGSRAIKLKNITVPIANRKLYLRKYGASSQIIPLSDFIKETTIFSKVVNVYIGGYRLYDVNILVDRFNSIYLIIPNSNTGVLSSELNSLINESPSGDIIISSTLRSTTYRYTGFLNTVISGTSGSNTLLAIPVSGELVKYLYPNITTRYNRWDCLISYGGSYGQHIYLATTAMYNTTTSSNQIVFEVPTLYVNHLKTRVNNATFIFIETPMKSEAYLYNYTEDIKPILGLGFKNNASNNVNLEIYEYDSTIQAKKNRLYSDTLKQSYFPNIFDFSSLNVNNSNLLIEVTEYPWSYVPSALHNSIREITDTIPNETYTTMIANDYLHLDGEPNFISFKPEDYPITTDDYLNSDYTDDARSYRIHKLVQTMMTDRSLYKDYLSTIKSTDLRVFNVTGTPNTLGFGGLSSMGSVFNGVHPVVSDNSATALSRDDVYRFSTPHSYIKYRTSGKETPANFYFDGTRVTPTIKDFYNGENYAYFSVALIQSLLTPYANRIRELSTPGDCIVVDIYPNAANSHSDRKSMSVTIGSENDKYNLFEDEDGFNVRLDDLVVFDTTSGDILDFFESFDVTVSIPTDRNDYMPSQESASIDTEVTIEYFTTSLGEIYLTMDNEPIILKGETLDLSLNDTLQNLVDAGIFPDIESALNGLTHGKLPSTNVTISPSDSSMIGREVTVVTGNFMEYSKNVGSNIVDDGSTKKLTFGAICYSTDTDKYMLYRNGKYVFSLSETNELIDIVNVSGNYGGSATINLPYDVEYSADDIFELIYQPTPYEGRVLEICKKLDSENNLMTYPITLYIEDINMVGKTIKEIFPPVNDVEAINNNRASTLLKSTNGVIDINDNQNSTFIYDGRRIPVNRQDIGSSEYSIYSNDELKSIDGSGVLSSDSNIESQYVVEKYLPQDVAMFDISTNRPLIDRFIDEVIR